MKYPTTHDAITRMKLEQLPSGKWTLVFRKHYASHSSIHGKEVPCVKSGGANGGAGDVFYFCGEFALPLKTYYDFFLETHSFSDREAAMHGDSQWSSAEMSAKAYDIQCMTVRGGTPIPRSSLLYLRDECIKKMLEGGTTNAEICALFSISDRYIRKLTDPDFGKVVDNRLAEKQLENKVQKDINAHVIEDPRYKEVVGMMMYTRSRASKKQIYGSFTQLEVFPMMQEVQGNMGVQGKQRFIPKICPVLRTPLAWGKEGAAVLAAPVIWRKTNTKPFGPDNVTIMSKLAAWMIEGEYAKKKVAAAMDSDTHEAWRDWQARHPFRPVA